MLRSILLVIFLLTSLISETLNKKEKGFLAIHPLGILLLNNLPTVILNKKEKNFLDIHSEINIGSDAKWMPYVYKTNDQKIIGLNVDLLNRINQLTGANFKLKVGVWKDIVNKAQEKKLDGITPSVKNKEREKFFNFSIPFLSQTISIVVKHGNPLNIRSKKDLEDKTIVIQEGNLFLEKLSKRKFPESKIIYKNSYEDVFEEVVFGTADATINEVPINFLKNENGLPYLNKVFDLAEEEGLVFSIRKDWPEAISILNKGIKAIPKEELEKLKSKWFGEFHFKLESQDLSDVDKKYIKKIKKIKVCADPTWYRFPKNEAYEENISINFLDTVLGKIGLDRELIHTKNWKESLNFLKTRKCDLISVIKKTKERSEYISFTKPYINYPVMLVTHKDTPYLYDLEKIRNKKIAVLKGHTIIKTIKEKYKNIEFVFVDNALKGLKKVHKKDVFAYIDLLPIFIPIFNEVKDIKINRELNMSLDLSMGIRSDDKHLYHIIEKSLNGIEEKEKSEIFNKLIEIAYKEKVDYTIVFQVLLFLIFIIFLIVYWNFQLKKGITKALLKNKQQEGLLYHYSKQDAMKDLVGNISHQWKQPVNELSSILFYIETKLYLKQKITQEDIKSSSLKFRNIIDYLSKTVSIFSNFYVHNESEDEVEILTLLKQAIFITEGSLKKYRVKINIDIKDKAPKVKGEELQQAILSILSNAKNILIEREITSPIISIRLYTKDENSIIEIEDNLGGIDNLNDNIFELGISSSKKGTGQGLYISKRIIQDKYNGYIYAKNINDGAIFYIVIPLS